MQKVILKFEVHEWKALVNFASQEHRPLQYQAEYIIRQALEQNGYLPTDYNHSKTELLQEGEYVEA